MIIFKHDLTDPWPAPTGTLRARLQAGALRVIDEDGIRVLYYTTNAIQEVQVKGLLKAEGALSLSSLSLAELRAIVEWAEVDTEAGTKSGLKRAIERHFGG
jgi:hypothetical protein